MLQINFLRVADDASALSIACNRIIYKIKYWSNLKVAELTL